MAIFYPYTSSSAYTVFPTYIAVAQTIGTTRKNVENIAFTIYYF